MIRGIGGKPYIDIEPFIDIKGFRSLHPEICKGFALAREYAKEGTWLIPGIDQRDASYVINWKPIYQAFAEYQALPEDHPIKIHGADIFPTNFKDYKQRNIFTRYLKATLDAYDPYVYYFLWEEGEWDDRGDKKMKTAESKFFPGLTSWVESLVATNVFSQIGRVICFLCDHDGTPFEHRDLQSKNGIFKSNEYTNHRNEFIHLRYRTKRGFYIWDPEEKNKIYLNTHAAFWNDQDWHGGEIVKTQEYGIRIDGVFTDEFRKKLSIDHLEYY